MLDEIAERLQAHQGLLALEGCGGLTAAKIVAETAEISRFRELKQRRPTG